MIYILAAIGALVVAMMLWRAFGLESSSSAQRNRFIEGGSDRTTTAKDWIDKRLPSLGASRGNRLGTADKSQQPPIGPDDDPEFLRRLSEQQRNRRDPGDNGGN